jgi:hypothetical protein
MPGAPIMLFDAAKAEGGAEAPAAGTLKLARAEGPDYGPGMDEQG